MAETFLKGKEELIKQLKQLGGDVEKGAIDSLKVLGQKITKEMRSSIKEMPGYTGSTPPGNPPLSKSGELKRRIKFFLSRAEIGKPIRMYVHVKFGTNAYYGHMLEYGTSVRRNEKGANRGTLAARPFFWPVVIKFIPTAQNAMREAIAKVAARYAKQQYRIARGWKRSHH